MLHRSQSISSRIVSSFLGLSCVLCFLIGCSTGEGSTPTDDKPLGLSALHAAAILNLEDFPRLKDAEPSQCCRIASLTYVASSDVKNAFEFQKKHLVEKKWKELPNSLITDQSASATFTRDGFTLSVTVSPTGNQGKVLVSLANHGNVELSKLPVPAGSKSMYAFPVSVAYVTEMSLDKTTEACRKLLEEQGWQPYGNAGNQRFFKRNGVRLSVFIVAAPAQGGKTMITYSTEQLSVDLPAPEETTDLRYVDQNTILYFDTLEPQDTIVKFYRKKLAETGWKATTDHPIQIDRKDLLIFRNPSLDMLTLEMVTVNEKLRVSLLHQTAAEVAAIEKALDEKMRKKKEKAGTL